MITKTATKKRCPWVGDDPLYLAYHDLEWGVPVHDDATLFECLTLEGAQAGLSWITVLKKRDRYREVFENFDPERVAKFTKRDINRILKDPGVIRNRLKIESTVNNAKAILALRDNVSGFDDFLWRYVDGKPLVSNIRKQSDYPSKTELSETISRDLKKQSFRFIGPTTVYAFMQAIGMVNDHSMTCFRRAEVKRQYAT